LQFKFKVANKSLGYSSSKISKLLNYLFIAVQSKKQAYSTNTWKFRAEPTNRARYLESWLCGMSLETVPKKCRSLNAMKQIAFRNHEPAKIFVPEKLPT